MTETEIDDRTPVLIGVGQASETPDRPDYAALSPVDLAARAVRAAITDAHASGDIAAAIDTVAAIRQFEISTPFAVAPFGRSNNLPRSIAARVGIDPERAILEIGGGQGPQRMLGELAQAIAEGRSDCALLTGSEAMSTVRHLQARSETRDWSEDIAGSLEDRGYGISEIVEPVLIKHGVGSPIATYALCENARRARLGRSVQQYRDDIGALFAPFTRVAAANPHAAAPIERSAAELAAETDRNRVVAEPYLRMTVARDQVNQAAALLLCSAGRARALGVPEARWVHIHAVADADELPVLQRPDLGRSPASVDAVKQALTLAGKSIGAIDWFDFYSCFAIPVFNICGALGLATDDPRGLTLTGGLPFFGGAGNNYSMHAIAEAVERVRARRGSYALIGANGGFMSKYSAGIYSTDPASWSDSGARRAKRAVATDGVSAFDGETTRASVETYTVVPSAKGVLGTIIARTENGARLVANAGNGDAATLAVLAKGEPFGRAVDVTNDGGRRTFTFAAQL